MSNIFQDLRFALRMLRKNPGFASVAVLVLAVGMGANTAIFSFVDAVLLRPLPYANADRLAVILLLFPVRRTRLRRSRVSILQGVFETANALPQSFAKIGQLRGSKK